jgi:hypothetical protein
MYCPQQGRLPGPVRTRYPDHSSVWDIKGDSLDYPFTTVTGINIIEANCAARSI